MYLTGAFLLGLGIVLLIPNGIAIACADSPGEVLGWLACGAVVPLPMIVGGIALIRKAEARQAGAPDADQAPEGVAAADVQPFGVVAGNVFHVLTAESRRSLAVG